MDVANAPVTYYITLSTRARTSKAALYMTLTLVCDALLVCWMRDEVSSAHTSCTKVYRVFVVCDRKYPIIVVPCILLLAAIGTFS
ncbi:uncharacterized protein PHACADRAFT_263340 [Phanerochaete carnosa HHB-10118-sp]|uniref:Uncharacterized protein n=1 Tax=Phanerochaete carnosa (strain HHB-10118-sp) TaxID=650164 RepID=K5UNJ8_PHACS|nr:uncharacterized protein PHACADRAFT_263340 [Phanerochaete carnosa HHB-10118-sp]EKM51301.1 hypothetical protein PHACADRAFT_263340 [Phanerochaete carnosa HHB-10118-sp]